jgi:hypothetical protein
MRAHVRKRGKRRRAVKDEIYCGERIGLRQEVTLGVKDNVHDIFHLRFSFDFD